MTTDRTDADRTDAAVTALLVEWAPTQRWYPAKGTTGSPQSVAVVRLPHPDARVELHLLRLPSGALLQVPVVLRDPGTSAVPGPTIGTLGADGPVVVDGCHDPAFVEAWLSAASWEDGGPVGDLADMRVVTGEQSNTSVLLPGLRPPAILKVFRVVGHGPNPDVEVPLALARAGWDGVPRPLAWLEGGWPEDGGTAHGHLGVLSELVVGAEDGFEMACRWAADGRDITGPATELGRTTARMHEALRRALPVPEDAGAQGRAEQVLEVLRRRAAAAVAAAPVLQERAARVDDALTRVEGLELPPLQRVHGDYHLGQVLHSDHGWSVLDFEGEPQAAAAERVRPDLALRDLAGMLRSFDYAAAVGGAREERWSDSARDALVEGYRSESGAAGDPRLLQVLELDKALYEVVYETRNRPAWVAIPLAGVDRLLAAT